MFRYFIKSLIWHKKTVSFGLNVCQEETQYCFALGKGLKGKLRVEAQKTMVIAVRGIVAKR